MTLVWNWLSVPGILAVLLACTMGIVLLALKPPRAQNRRLALLLFLDAGFAAAASGFTFILTHREDAYAMQMVAMVLASMLPFAYLRFLATIDSPLARPLRNRFVDGGLVALMFLTPGWALTNPSFFVKGLVQPPYAIWDGDYGVGLDLVFLLLMFTLVYGLAIAIQALRRAKTNLAREKARAYVVAFGVRDGLFLILTILIFYLDYWLTLSPYVPIVLSQSIAIAFIPILSYGILKHQLFDLDLKIKFALKGSTLATIFLGAFFVVEQLVQSLAGQAFGVVAGALAAGLLFFAIHPLQRLSGRVADAAMPRVQATSAYLDFKKLEVYKAALESALPGGVSAKERRTLDSLKAKLGISARDGAAVERDVQAEVRAAA